MSHDTGVYVQSVIRGTPAFEGGLRHGDVILRVSGLDVTDTAFLRDRLELFGGMSVDVIVLRDGVLHTLNITPRP
jgi:S1-C subfamily serine protease